LDHILEAVEREAEKIFWLSRSAALNQKLSIKYS
jgi:hypothetical protein